jgi:hypothetical protein
MRKLKKMAQLTLSWHAFISSIELSVRHFSCRAHVQPSLVKSVFSSYIVCYCHHVLGLNIPAKLFTAPYTPELFDCIIVYTV